MKILRSRKKRIIVVSIIIVSLLILGVAYYCGTSYRNKSADEINKEFLKKYGWENVTGGNLYNPRKLSMDYDLEKLKIEVSEKIGLEPKKYIGKILDVYSYNLGRNGDTQPLSATLLVYEKQIVCAYILHSEPKILIKYWPLNTSYTDIVNDIQKAKNNEK